MQVGVAGLHIPDEEVMHVSEESREGWFLPADEATRPKRHSGVEKMEEVLSAKPEVPRQCEPIIKDAITGQALIPELVRAARRK